MQHVKYSYHGPSSDTQFNNLRLQTMMTINNRPPSKTLTFEDAVKIWPKIWAKEYQNRIAAEYDVNPGRISEIKSELLHSGSYDEAVKQFGPPKSFRRISPLPLFDLIQKKRNDDA